ncbi:hypothetical protein B4134_3833 [Bacillus safensis]|nr:hypothetical protein B4134_3833 [Bacillus safensis]
MSFHFACIITPFPFMKKRLTVYYNVLQGKDKNNNGFLF